MKGLIGTSLGFFVGMLLFLPFSAAVAQDSTPAGPDAGISQDQANRDYFSDVEVITQDGERLRFYSDVLKDRVVLINFFYINCPTAPPGMIGLFKAQKLLGDELGKDIFFISISVDPENDTPQAVKEYASKFNPPKGWIFLTGSKNGMDLINRKLGNRLSLPEGHIQNFLMGNVKTGNWMRMLPSAPPAAVAEGLRSLRQQ
jgi:protein SCO1/2